MTDNNFIPENTKVLHGIENTIALGIKFFDNTEKRFDIFVDKTSPSTIINNQIYRNDFENAYKRGIRVRFITEITTENIEYCRQIKNFVDEFKHFGGLQGALCINESEFLGTTLCSQGNIVNTVIHSTEKEVVLQQQFIFNTFWKNAIPFDKRIKEIEEGIESVKTEILEEEKEISSRMIELAERSTEMQICSTLGGLQLIYNQFFEVYSDVSRKHRNRKHKGIRWVTTINNKDDARLVRLFLDEGVRIRHISYLPLPSFTLSDKMLNSTIENMKDGKMVTNLLSSNDSLYLNHYNTIFNVSWETGVDAEKRIVDIEKGHYSNTRIISNPKESHEIISELVDSVNDEILILVPSENGISHLETADGFELLNDLALKDIKVKVLHAPVYNDKQNILQKIKSNYPRIEFRSLHTTFQPIIRITILDREKTVLMEISNDTSEDFLNAVGLSLLIESKSTALSYVSIFNNLWNQSEMYEKLQEAYELLNLHDKMKNEFIGLVAHELRTPLTPIIGLSEHLRDKLTDNEQKKILDIVIGDSKKLRTLTEKILDVTRIEGKLFKLEKEKFSLNQLILDIVKDFENNFLDKDKKNKIEFKYDAEFRTENYLIIADKIKIGQVISNLIENSIKSFSYERKGKEIEAISITMETKKFISETNVYNKKRSFVIVSIKDNGSGIDDEIFPRLFTKFASKSFQGTGLGLYLSKNIIEAHGGTIWGNNNKDSRGATFSFSLPLND